MEKVILNQVKHLIEDSTADTSLISLRKTSYVEGYLSAMKDVKRLIDYGETLSGIKAETSPAKK